MLELVRRFSQVQLLAKKAALSRQWLRSDDPSNTTFSMIRAVKALYSPASEVENLKKLDDELDELLSYLDRPSPGRHQIGEIKELQERTVTELDVRGFSALEIYALLPKLTARTVGHPVTARLDAVEAADMFDGGLSWTQIAQKLYRCKDAADCFRRRDSIRKAVKSLDALFHKLGIPIPQRKSSRKSPLSKRK